MNHPARVLQGIFIGLIVAFGIVVVQKEFEFGSIVRKTPSPKDESSKNANSVGFGRKSTAAVNADRPWAVVSLNRDGAVMAKFAKSASGIQLLGVTKVRRIEGENYRFDFDTAVRSLGAKGLSVDVCYSHLETFIRFVKLPSVGPEQMEQIVTFEASQNVPYPIDEVSWWWRLIPSGETQQTKVMIAAVKLDIAEAIGDALRTAGMHPVGSRASSEAVHDCFRNTRSASADNTLIVCLGGEIQMFLFEAGNPPSFFSRSVSIKGLTEWRAPAQSQGSRTSPDILGRFAAETERTIRFYVSQQGESRPGKLIVLESTPAAKHLNVALAERLGLSTESFDPASAVAIKDGVNLSGQDIPPVQVAEIIGTALKHDFAASDPKTEKARKKRISTTLALLVVPLLAGLLLYRVVRY